MTLDDKVGLQESDEIRGLGAMSCRQIDAIAIGHSYLSHFLHRSALISKFYFPAAIHSSICD